MDPYTCVETDITLQLSLQAHNDFGEETNWPLDEVQDLNGFLRQLHKHVRAHTSV